MSAATRAFSIPVLLIAAATLGVHVASSHAATSWMWGAHFYAFFSSPYLYGASALATAAILLLVIRERECTSTITRIVSWSGTGWRRWCTPCVAVTAGMTMFWMLRICHTYLGDGSVIVQDIDGNRDVLPREPLTSVLQHVVHDVTKSRFQAQGLSMEATAHNTMAMGSVANGGLFLVVAWLLAGELSRLAAPHDGSHSRRPVTFLLWLILVTQGYMQLFFGYVENYAFQAVGIALFLWLGLRYLRGACALLWPALAMVLCVALHFSSMLLGVSFLVLVGTGLRDQERRRETARDLALCGFAIALVILLAFQRYDPVRTFRDMFQTAFGSSRESGYMFSPAHIRDFLNEQLLIGPLGMFLFAGASICTLFFLRGTRSRALLFSLAAGLCALAACWLMEDPNLGYARDWDMLAHTGIVFTTAGLALMLVPGVRHSALVATLAVGVVISVYHTAPWIMTNTSEARSLARLETLPLGRGRTEVMVAWWYNRKGDELQERAWLQRSIVAYQGNPSAYYMLGVLDMRQKEYNDAILAFRHTVALRPDKVEFRGRLAHAYYLANRLPEATPHLRYIVGEQEANALALFYLGESLEQAGQTNEALTMFARAEPLCRDAAAERPHDGSAAATYGWVLFRLGCDDESLHELNRAVALARPSPVAECYLGYVLQRLQHYGESRARFETCLDRDPEVPERDRLEAWLSGTGPPP